MKIDSVVIKDSKTGTFFTFIRQFPGICAQGATSEEANEKVNKYFKIFIDRMKDEEVEMDNSKILSM